MKRRWGLVLIGCLAFAGMAWLLLPRILGPKLPAYEVTARPLVQTVVATGRVAALSRAQVGSTLTGVVVERRVREGDRVQPGDVLAILRSEDLEAAVREAEAALAALQESTRPQAYAALREAESTLEQTRREAQRRRELFDRRAISREEMERAIQAEATARAVTERARLEAQSLSSGNANEAVARARLANAQAQLEKTTIRAEVAGTVLTRNAEPGDLVQPSRMLFEIARDGDTEVLVPLDEKNLGVLAIGQRAMCIADAYPSRPFPATVSFIAPSIDPQRGTVDVRLRVTDVPEFLREDMTVSVNVETGRREHSIAVPNDAMLRRERDSAELWVVVNGRAERRKVMLGLRGLTSTEITAGLQVGDIVLADGDAAIKPGTRVRAVLGTSPAQAAERATRNETPIPMD